MTEPEATCMKCDTAVSESASVCPHCGYDPGSTMSNQANWRLGIGALLCFTIIGGVIGIPLVISGLRHQQRAKEATPAAVDV